MTTRGLADANVLYSRTLRDRLPMLQIESKGAAFAVYGAEDILAEVFYHLRREALTVDMVDATTGGSFAKPVDEHADAVAWHSRTAG